MNINVFTLNLGYYQCYYTSYEGDSCFENLLDCFKIEETRAYLIEGGIEMIPKQSLKTEVTERMIYGTGCLGRPERAQYAEHRIQGDS